MGFLVALMLMTGLSFAQSEGSDELEVFFEVVEQRLGDQVPEDELRHAALNGAANYIDELFGTTGSQVLTIDAYEALESWDKGHRRGIGVEFEIVTGQGLLLTDVFADSPAAAAGLERGDLVVGVNGTPFTGLGPVTIHQVVMGQQTSRFRLDVRRADGTLRRMTVEKGPYRVDTVNLVPGSAPPEIRVHFFGEGTSASLAAVLRDLDDPDAVMLDLRDNEGGLLSEVVAVSSLFLEPDTVVVQRVDPDGRSFRSTTSGTPAFDGRVGIVVNGGTSGLAEAFVAAMQDHRRAVVVGTPTAGVCTTPTFYPLGEELVLKLEDQFLRSPLGRDWSEAGLEPHQLVQPPQMNLPGGRDWVPPDLQRDATLKLISAPDR